MIELGFELLAVGFFTYMVPFIFRFHDTPPPIFHSTPRRVLHKSFGSALQIDSVLQLGNSKSNSSLECSLIYNRGNGWTSAEVVSFASQRTVGPDPIAFLSAGYEQIRG